MCMDCGKAVEPQMRDIEHEVGCEAKAGDVEGLPSTVAMDDWMLRLRSEPSADGKGFLSARAWFRCSRGGRVVSNYGMDYVPTAVRLLSSLRREFSVGQWVIDIVLPPDSLAGNVFGVFSRSETEIIYSRSIVEIGGVPGPLAIAGAAREMPASTTSGPLIAGSPFAAGVQQGRDAVEEKFSERFKRSENRLRVEKWVKHGVDGRPVSMWCRRLIGGIPTEACECPRVGPQGILVPGVDMEKLLGLLREKHGPGTWQFTVESIAADEAVFDPVQRPHWGLLPQWDRDMGDPIIYVP